MATAPKAFWYGLLLCVGAFAGFACWGIFYITADLDAVSLQTQITLESFEDAGRGLSSIEGHVGDQVTADAPKLAAVLDNAEKATAGLDRAVSEINRPCSKTDSCGTIADVDRAVMSVRLAAGQVTAVSLHERTQLDAINKQETETAAVAKDDLLKFGTAIDSLNTLVSDPKIKETVVKVDGIATHVEGTTADFQKALHPILNPDPCTTRGCRIKRDFSAARGAAQTSEALYYTIQVLKEIF